MKKTITIHTRGSYWSSYERHDELEVDSEDLAIEIEKQCNKLAHEGFEVVQILPINSGNMVLGSGSYYTKSIIIVAQKKT